MFGHLKSFSFGFLLLTLSLSTSAQTSSVALSDYAKRIEEYVVSLKNPSMSNANRAELMKTQYHAFGEEHLRMQDLPVIVAEDDVYKYIAFNHFNRVTLLSKLELGANGKGTAESCAYASSLLAVMGQTGNSEMTKAGLPASELDKNVESVIQIFCN